MIDGHRDVDDRRVDDDQRDAEADDDQAEPAAPTAPGRAGRPPGRRGTCGNLAVTPTTERPTQRVRPLRVGGGEGTRTPDPLHAMQMRYQLRHTPNSARTLADPRGEVKSGSGTQVNQRTGARSRAPRPPHRRPAGPPSGPPRRRRRPASAARAAARSRSHGAAAAGSCGWPGGRRRAGRRRPGTRPSRASTTRLSPIRASTAMGTRARIASRTMTLDSALPRASPMPGTSPISCVQAHADAGAGHGHRVVHHPRHLTAQRDVDLAGPLAHRSTPCCTTPAGGVRTACARAAAASGSCPSRPRVSSSSSGQPSKPGDADAQRGAVGHHDAGLPRAEGVEARAHGGHDAGPDVRGRLGARHGQRLVAGQPGGVLVGERGRELVEGQAGALAHVVLAQAGTISGVEPGRLGERRGGLAGPDEVAAPDPRPGRAWPARARRPRPGRGPTSSSSMSACPCARPASFQAVRPWRSTTRVRRRLTSGRAGSPGSRSRGARGRRTSAPPRAARG